MISKISLILIFLFAINGLVVRAQNNSTNSSSEPTESTNATQTIKTTTLSPTTTTTMLSTTTTTTKPTTTIQPTITVTLTPFTTTNTTISAIVSVSTPQSPESEPSSNSTTNSTTNATTITTPIASSSTNPPTSQSTPSVTSQSTPPATSQSTSPPSSQTTPTPTTLAPPTLPPSPPEAPANPWNVSYSGINGTVCILAEFALTLRIEYNSTDIKHNVTGFNIPPDASVDNANSYCNNITQVLSLNFNIMNQTNGNITFTFNQTKDNVFIDKIKLVYNLTEDLFPNYVNKEDYGKMIIIENDGLNLFNVDHTHSYRCHSQTAAQLENVIELNISDAKVQAYIPQTNINGFSDESVCKQDIRPQDISNTVPIIVGASLGGLVLIVLIVFFIGRQRNRKASYTSV